MCVLATFETIPDLFEHLQFIFAVSMCVCCLYAKLHTFENLGNCICPMVLLYESSNSVLLCVFFFFHLFSITIIFHRAIKLSSPKLSNITAFGCILVYAAVILLGLDHSTLPATEKAFPVVCTVSGGIN